MSGVYFYYLSIGTNLNPEKNAVAITRELISCFGRMYLFPFIHTLPEKLETENHFLNAVAIIRCELDSQALKSQLNEIEMKLGRNRKDPDRSNKDRPADIDIISEPCAVLDASCQPALEESYIKNVIDCTGDRADLTEFGLMFSDVPATVDLDMATGHIMIVEDSENRFIQR